MFYWFTGALAAVLAYAMIFMIFRAVRSFTGFTMGIDE